RSRLNRPRAGSGDPGRGRTGGDRRRDGAHLPTACRSARAGLRRRHGIRRDRNGTRHTGRDGQKPRVTRENRTGRRIEGAAMTETNATTHEHVQGMLAGYAAGSVDATEQDVITAHVAECAECGNELAAWQAI